MSKQWGHGFYTGKGEGFFKGREEMWITDLEIGIAEIDWVIEELAGHFQCEPAEIEPMAIARAMTFLIAYKKQKENQLKEEKQKTFTP